MCAGEGPCLATYFVRRYWQLLVLRILTGISVGGTFPLVFSLVRGSAHKAQLPVHLLFVGGASLD